MATLQNVHGASLMPDLSGGLSLLTQSFQKQQDIKRAEEAAAAKQQQINQIMGGQTGMSSGSPAQGGSPQMGQEQLMRIAQIDPKLAETLQGIMERGDELEIQQVQAETERGVREAALLQKAKTQTERMNTLNSLAASAQAEGRPIDRYVEIANMSPAQQDLELQRMMVMGTDIKSLTEKPKPTALMQNVEAAGLQPGTKEYQQALRNSVTGVLSPEALAQKQQIAAAGASGSGAPQVQSSTILPSGLVQMVMKNGEVRVVEPDQANKELIRSAELWGAELQGRREGERGEAKTATKVAANAYENLAKARTSIGNMNEAIDLLKNGAKTGAVQSKLPAVKAASVKLDNLRKRMGLDVIGGTTFGALSESELNFALSASLPTGLDESELIKWLEEKRSAQTKVIQNLEEAALFLGTPGNTVADFIKLKKEGTKQQDTPQQQAPQQAIDYLIANPQFAEQFKAKYGYLPEGM